MSRTATFRLFFAILASLHVLAAPCAMALATAVGEGPCEHCDGDREFTACASGAAEPGNDAGAGGRHRDWLPDDRQALIQRVPRALTATAGLAGSDPADPGSRGSGRHCGDPPLNVLYGRYLI